MRSADQLDGIKIDVMFVLRADDANPSPVSSPARADDANPSPAQQASQLQKPAGYFSSFSQL